MEKITVQVTVNADIQKAWDYWTDAEHIKDWNFATDDWHCPRAENDARTGGKFSARMEAKDGSFGFDFEGVYDEVIPLEKIAYSMADGREVVIKFQQTGPVTTVTEMFDPESENPREMQQAGWQMIMDNYKKLVEAN